MCWHYLFNYATQIFLFLLTSEQRWILISISPLNRVAAQQALLPLSFDRTIYIHYILPFPLIHSAHSMDLKVRYGNSTFPFCKCQSIFFLSNMSIPLLSSDLALHSPLLKTFLFEGIISFYYSPNFSKYSCYSHMKSEHMSSDK